ncbi:MAG: PAS domain S-box protein [Candidatus Lokiarchaeota archaeon]|nr:PAS domain S-box protein [Candidatus Lokiarchaeota archaeon]MBD3199452.1 PAS domain S-box protein [Candidatus Lokiarchaeota archaeon]
MTEDKQLFELNDLIGKKILENLNELVILVNQKYDFKIEYFNTNAFNKILGYNENELLDQSFLKILHQDDIRNVVKILKRGTGVFLQNNKSKIQLLAKDGKFRWFQIKATHISIKNQKKILIILKSLIENKELEEKLIESKKTIKNITNKIPEIRFWKLFSTEEYDEALQNSYEMLHKVIENIPQYIYWKDKNLRYLGCNDNYAELIGVEYSENVIGKKDNEIVKDHKIVDKIHNIESKILDSGLSQINEIIPWSNYHNEKRLLEVNRLPLFNRQQEVVGVLGCLNDITDYKRQKYELQRERDILSRIMETSPTGIVVADKDGKLTYVNSQAESVLGLSKEELTNTYFNNISKNATKFDGDPFPEEQFPYNIVKKTEKPIFNVQIVINRKEKEKVLLNINASPILDRDGDFDGIVAIVKDVTQDIEKEKKLRDSEERYRHLFESSPYGIGLFDLKGVLIDCNNTTNQFLSARKREDIVGKSFADILSNNKKNKRFIPLVTNLFNQIKSEKAPKSIEFEIQRTNGEKIWINLYCSLINLEETILIQAIVQDITQRKKAQSQLKESEKKYRFLFENSPDMIALLNEEGIFIDINNEFMKFFQINDKNQIIGDYIQDFYNLILEEDFPADDLLKTILKNEYVHSREIRLQLDDNEIKWLNFQATITEIGKNKLIHAIMHDITERKKFEKVLKSNELRLEALAKLNQTQTTSEEKIGKFAVDHAVELTNSRMGIFLLLDQNQKSIKSIHFSHMLRSENMEELTNKIKNKKSEMFQEFVDCKRATINNSEGYKTPYLESPIFNKFKIETYLISPILDQNEVVGLIFVMNNKQRYTNLDVDQLTLFMDGVWKVLQRIRAERAVRESEEKYRNLLDTSSVGIIEIELEEKTPSYVNSELLDILGFKREEISERTMEKIIHPEDISKFFKNRQEKELEFRVITKDGQVRWVSGKRINQYDEEGKIISLRLWLEDVTDKKTYENLITELNINFLNFTTDIENNIQKLLKTSNNLLGSKLSLYVHKNQETDSVKIITSDNSSIKQTIDEFEQTCFIQELFEENHDYPQTILDIDEIKFYEEDSLIKKYNIKGGYGKLVKTGNEFNHCLCVFYDKNPIISHEYQLVLFLISDAIEIEERRWQAKKHLENQNKMLNEMNKLKSELFSRTSHELKTPLISIKGFTELLLSLHRSKLDSDMASILEEIMDGAKRLEKIINTLIKSSKLDNDLLKINSSKEDLKFLINYCVNELQGLANLRNQEIKLNLNNKMVAEFDKERIYEVISNLIVNAIKFTPPGGKISINSEDAGDSYIISVKDTGVGLDEKEKRILFKQFGKIERYGKGYDLGIEGTGMGLYISKKIIDLHNGDIWAESEGRNKGSTFYFRIPKILNLNTDS